MKDRYLDIMARVVDVYTPERFDSYLNKTRSDGISEHGFPRLCANIGILIAHGRMLHLKPRFEEMMDICCHDIPAYTPAKSKRGNDFSVREILSCILELEANQVYPPVKIAKWKKAMAQVDPKSCYRMVAPEPPVPVDNWAAFNASGEQLRCSVGIADTHSYIENQIASQMFSFDENGMYRDPNDPMVYDMVGRNMLAACLHFGYNGQYAKKLESNLISAGIPTMLMQSVTGELPYGGRSNQFMHNEAHIAACTEFAAALAYKHGDIASAGKLKASANMALDCLERWLDQAPGQHIKNYFLIDSMFGCEKYAYYDKYMVTVASFLYLAFQFCDERIQPTVCPAQDDSCYTWQTSDAFRKLFCKAGSYFIEIETKSDTHYDAEGIGRIHRRGAPSAICLSTPASQTPNYNLGTPNPMALAICCGLFNSSEWVYGFDNGIEIAVIHHESTDTETSAKLLYTFPNNNKITQTITMKDSGIDISLTGDGMIALTLPAFLFDGKEHTEISYTNHKLAVYYKNWSCNYTTNATINDLCMNAANRNGIYKIYQAEADQNLYVHISIDPI